MRIISFLITIWFIYVVYRVFVRPLVRVFLTVWGRQRAAHKRSNQSDNSYQQKQSPYDNTKIVDAEFEEIE
ncbi:MAG: hypothetical protein ABIH71_00150 [Candidatus Omnitrophota bacterium]|nr:hypothetical protein [Candidatus Omnitrophota bacterium]